MSAAVAAISQRNQATLPVNTLAHLIFIIPVFNRLYCLAKASGFCLYFYRSFDALRLPGTTRDPHFHKFFHYTTSTL